MFKDITIELLVSFFTLIIVLKVLGKIQFSQITPFDFITGLVLGNFVGEAIFDKNVGIMEIIFSIAIWGSLIYFVEVLTQKSNFLRGFFEGIPSILIKKGKLDYLQLKKNHIDLNQLQNLLRKQGYFSIYEVEYVILEQDGSISILPKSQYDTPKNKDLNIPPKKIILPYALILDGKINKVALKELGLDESWLKQQLADQDIKDILYAEWLEDSNELKISKYHDKY